MNNLEQQVLKLHMANLRNGSEYSVILSKLLDVVGAYVQSELNPADEFSETRKVSKEWMVRELMGIAGNIAEAIGTMNYVYADDGSNANEHDPIISE